MLYKSSRQRDMILDYMKDIHTHVSAEEIFDTINKEEKKISLATVYRNLNILETMQLVKKIALPNDGYVYDKTCIPHYHFYCDQCRTLYDLEMPYDTTFNTKVLDESVISNINSHEITFRGVCKNCK